MVLALSHDNLIQARNHIFTPMLDNEHILIVEDEALFASKMEMQIDKLGHNCVGIEDNSVSALHLIESEPVTLILMDINIQGDYDGIELAEKIQSQRDITILFVTSNHDDLSFKRATRNGAAGFITKPFTDIQLQRAIELAISQKKQKDLPSAEEISRVEGDSIFIKKTKAIVKVLFEDIFYLEADGRYSRIYTKGEKFLVRQALKKLTERLPVTQFIQCHRSYVVNINKIKSVNIEDDVILLEERTVPLSRREKDRLLERLDYI